ncbi:MAG: hypothetical protein PHV55_04800 [Candidatus Omnitrophica bacterium]|nr:hypothetical protein [Candidatus Omnitrophota bacterium]
MAPIHNPISYKLIELCHEDFSSIPQFAVFDTAFHSSIPKEFYTYAIPARLAARYGLRKIGFHGISHQYVMGQACRYLKRDPKQQRIISCHLGTGGSSVCAIEAGKSKNSSMGFTPLEGLIMNTRCGDVDLGLLFYIMFKEGFSAAQAEDILNKKSGILGIFNASSDLRDVAKIISKNRQAKLAFDMYIKRARKYVSFYALILKKADILIFTDSLGVGMPLVREKICANLQCLGIQMDVVKSNAYKSGICDITGAGAQTKVLIVPTNEEVMIARQAYTEYCHDSGC